MKLNSKSVFISITLFVSPGGYGSQNKPLPLPPNIIFILADDLGYSDVGFSNRKQGLQTPNINKLAKNGMVFTNAYASCPVCSPTRASVLTGKYPAMLHLTCHIPGIGKERYMKNVNKGQKMMDADFIDHLPLNETTFAEILKEQGYYTAFIGKWHLAGEGSLNTDDGIVNKLYHPENHGFDINIAGCAYGQPPSYFSPYKIGTIPDGPVNEYLTDRLGDEACKFIKKSRNHPFLLFFSTYSVHTPHQAPEEIVQKYKGNKYYAMIEKLDQNVGKILAKVEELGLYKNTLIIFYSDNGGLQQNPPLRSRKGSLYEGGIRVPLIFYYPGLIEGGTLSDVPFTSPDIFPTITDFAGIKLNKTQQNNLEGISFWSHICKGKFVPERPIFWHFPHNRNIEKSMASAIREGNWKLIWDYKTDSLSLFNLVEDVDETDNLSSEYPVKATQLQEKIKNWLEESNAFLPILNPDWPKN